MRSRTFRALALLAVAAIGAACGDSDDVVTDPTPPRETVTETFTGRVTVNGAVTHAFVASGSGRIDLTLTSLAPDPGVRVGAALGTWNAATGSCALQIVNDNATQGAIVIGQAGSAGSFCARIYDVGQLAAATDYTITVVHF